MVGSLLLRGMLTGLLAGLLMFGFAKLFGEPQIDRAIAIETRAHETRIRVDLARGIHDIAEPEIVGRRMQAGLGLLTGVVVYAAAFGGLFALVFAFADGRVLLVGPRAVSALLGAAGFVAVALVPALKYPANPPAIGVADTIGERTLLYAVMLGLSVAAMIGAAATRRHLSRRHDGWTASLVAASFYALAAIALAALLPAIDEVPPGFPAQLLWRFRIDSLCMQAILWGVLGLGFGSLNAFLDRRGPSHSGYDRFSGAG